MPVNDENAPDLYIPIMSLITYVLLCALCYGNAGQFNPEVIPDVCSKCFLTQALEVVAIRVGFYMMQSPMSFLDLWSYTGYKYLGLCINLLLGLLGRSLALGGLTTYYVSFFWTASAASFFMLKIMSHTVPRQTAADGPKRKLFAKRLLSLWHEPSLLFECVCQEILFSLFVVTINRRDHDFMFCWIANGYNVVCGSDEVSLNLIRLPSVYNSGTFMPL